MSLIENERIKLSAGWLDRASTACLTIGIVTPIAGYVYGLTTLPVWYLVAACYVWLSFAAGLHWLARRMLGRLQQQ